MIHSTYVLSAPEMRCNRRFHILVKEIQKQGNALCIGALTSAEKGCKKGSLSFDRFPF